MVFVEIVFDGDPGGDVALVAVLVESVGIGFPVVIGQMAVAFSGADILAGLHDVDLVFVAPGVVGRCLAGEPEGVVHARRSPRTEPAFDVDVVFQRLFEIDIACDPFDLLAAVDLADVETQLSVAHLHGLGAAAGLVFDVVGIFGGPDVPVHLFAVELVREDQAVAAQVDGLVTLFPRLGRDGRFRRLSGTGGQHCEMQHCDQQDCFQFHRAVVLVFR